jgi:hypothetical protein
VTVGREYFTTDEGVPWTRFAVRGDTTTAARGRPSLVVRGRIELPT